MIRHFRRLSLLVTIVSFSIILSAQNSDDARDVTATYFIKNAFVVQQPGKVLPKTSVVIRDGIIADMGGNISAPWDAKVIDADSMYLYAAFIDAASHAGISKGDDKDRPKVDDPGNPPNDVAGITPQHKAVDLIDYSESSIKSMREIGYGYLHVLPRGRMLPGSGAIITTGEGGKEHMVIDDQTVMFSQLRSARGVFPNTVIGVMSKYRDIYKNAGYNGQNRMNYSKSPQGLTRPMQSEELTAMQPVVNRTMPVYFKAEKARDIFRVMSLQKDLGFDLVLTDVKQGNLVAEKVSGIPMVLSLDLPKKIEDEKDDKEDEKKDGKADIKDSDEKAEGKSDEESDKKEPEVVPNDGENKDGRKPVGDKPEKVDPAKSAFDLKKMQSYAQYESQAADLAKKGVAFSFSSLSVKSGDIKKNIERMMARGLTADQALAGLTTNAAKQTGLSAVAGTVEKGKLGNVFISDKPYFEEKSKIKYTIIDGKLYEYKEKKKKKKGSGSGDGADLSGSWSYELEIPGQTSSGTMVIEKDGDNYKVKLDGSDDPGDFEDAFDVEVDGDVLTFGLTVDNDGFKLNITSEMTFDGDDFEGTMSVNEFGSFPVTGSKKDPK